ncbi:NAD(P)/FAD-dependent oxidoreductase [Sphingomonas aerophila]|uniref:Glycerol-3-phosphate dehydrogenase n=1 Tax=Sphingomonas aerophila TaxID=1344948 RepID=A0A7W9BGS7_9SPHN|nr:FAD-dependent oxidoreductase [Sphingomonas aerophila]MBB5716867.1 glycerol-3-phosphate dehydrogenase [Sphingomonas aerophila]
MAEFDAVVVGGGIQGLMVAWEIARHGGRPLLLERNALGSGASNASLGIVHGGLRYLQSLDVRRWHRSRREQLWFAREFAAYTRSIDCVMPLYRGAFRSRSLFRTAFLLERAMARVTGLVTLGRKAHLVTPAEVAGGYPIPRAGLVGGAVWPELAVDDPLGLMRNIAGRIEQAGGVVREHEEVVALDLVGSAVRGVVVRGAQRETRYAANTVMLCVGAASRSIARRLDRDLPALSARTLAFNLLLDVPAVSGQAVAVSPVPGRGRSYFLRDRGGRLLAGTYYAPIEADLGRGAVVTVPPTLVEAFLKDLCAAAPWLKGVSILETWAGLLPDVDGGGKTLRAHDLVLHHGDHGGPRGLWTLLGTKLTTAHALAGEAVNRALFKPSRQRDQVDE